MKSVYFLQYHHGICLKKDKDYYKDKCKKVDFHLSSLLFKKDPEILKFPFPDWTVPQ